MSEVNKDNHPFQTQDSKNKQDNIKKNPFETYQSNNPLPNNQKETTSTILNQRERSSSKSSRNYSQEGKEASQTLERNQFKDVSQKKQTKNFERQENQGHQETPQASLQNIYDEQVTYFKTKLCPLFSKGLCKKGTDCSFAHGDKELRGLPNFRKTRLCQAFNSGQCPKKSQDCKYAHGQGELRKLVYDYIPQKRKNIDQPNRRSQDRGYRGRQEFNRRDNRGTKDSKQRRDERRPKDRRDRERSRDRQYRDRNRDRDFRGQRERFRQQRDRYTVEYPMRPDMYSYGYPPANYSNPYMIGGMGYGPNGEQYGISSGNGGNGNFGSGNPPPPSSFSGSNPGYAPYGYNYGYLPYPPYNPNSV